MGIVSLAIRSGVCIYAVKYTVDQGVWSDAEKAIAFKNRTCEAINGNEYVQTGKAHFQTFVPLPKLPELPQSSEIGFVSTHYYNKSVKCTIHFIEMIPCYAGQLIKKVNDSVKSAMETPPPVQS